MGVTKGTDVVEMLEAIKSVGGLKHRVSAVVMRRAEVIPKNTRKCSMIVNVLLRMPVMCRNLSLLGCLR